MPITLKGIRLEGVTLARTEATNSIELNSASYSLISSTDKVLARQTIGGYESVKVPPSSDTLKLLEEFVNSYKKDVTATLGLEGA